MTTQCGATTADRGTQTKRLLDFPSLSNRPDDSLNESILSVGSEDPEDPEWIPPKEDTSDSDENMEVDDDDWNEAKEPKYIVFESCLNELLKQCALCGSSNVVEKKIMGTCVLFTLNCATCGNESVWRSQPMSGNMPLGNLLISAAILFSGGSAVKFLRALDFVNITNISISTYNLIQSSYLTPTVLEVWKNHQRIMTNSIRDRGRALRIAGDMRCCSPGHTAKYGSYSMIDLEAGQVLDIQLVQVCSIFNKLNSNNLQNGTCIMIMWAVIILKFEQVHFSTRFSRAKRANSADPDKNSFI